MLGKPSVIYSARFAKPYDNEFLEGFRGLSLDVCGELLRLFFADWETPASLISVDGMRSALVPYLGDLKSVTLLWFFIAEATCVTCEFWMPTLLEVVVSCYWRTELKSRFVISNEDAWVLLFLQLIGGDLTLLNVVFDIFNAPMLIFDLWCFRSWDLL